MKPTIWYLMTIEKVDGSCDNNGIYIYIYRERECVCEIHWNFEYFFL
jgi:hypothetical protein